MINVRSDGRRLLLAQRLERDKGKSKRWDYYGFTADSHGRLARDK